MPPPHRKSGGTSIVLRLLIAFLGVVTVSSGLLTSVFYIFSARASRVHAQEQVVQLLASIDQTLQGEFYEEIARDLQALATNPLVDDYVMASSFQKPVIANSVERLFLQILRRTAGYEQLSLVNSIGWETVKVDRAGRSRTYQDAREDPLVLRLRAAPPNGINSDPPVRGARGDIAGRIGIHKVDPDIGRFGGAIILRYSLADFLRSLEKRIVFGENCIWVLRPSGEILQQPPNPFVVFDPRPHMAAGAQFAPRIVALNNGLLAYQDWQLGSQEPAIRIAISVPAALALRDVRKTLIFFLAVFAVSLLAAAGLAVYISRHFSKPIIELADATSRIAGGAPIDKVEVAATGEVQVLVESFNRMLQDLQKTTVSRDLLLKEIAEREQAEEQLRQLNESLEKRVAERTNQLLSATTAERQRATELARSNAELEQFAYVASHDLQEPLRMVASYTQLLARRYQGKLDADADEFIKFAVDGAIRMQRLITDLLHYSRVGTKGKPFAPTNCEAVLEHVLKNLQLAIKEAGAEVTHGPLPTVMGDELQLMQLFQNLIGNAIKFRQPSVPPRIRISAAREEAGWRFQVADNGIGFDPQHADRIFVVFQRLHTSDEYPGTGIGLAICKKIVERHGGRIWTTSSPGHGATFSFILPAEPQTEAHG